MMQQVGIQRPLYLENAFRVECVVQGGKVFRFATNRQQQYSLRQCTVWTKLTSCVYDRTCIYPNIYETGDTPLHI